MQIIDKILYFLKLKRKIPKMDEKVYNLFKGIHASKDFTIENAHKHFGNIKR